MVVALLLLVVLVGLVGYGAGVRPGVTLAMAAVLGVVYVARSWDEYRGGRRLPWLNVALVVSGAAWLLYLAVTVVPLPVSWQAVLGERRTGQTERVTQAVERAHELGLVDGVPDTAPTLSRNRAGTWRTWLLLLGCLCAMGLAARLPWRTRDWFLPTLVLIVVAVAVAGFISQWIIPQGKLLWWYLPVREGKTVGCFINRNHFAGFVALAMPLALAWCADAFSEWRADRGIGWAACLAAMGTAVVASLSRGAFLAMLAGLVLTGAGLCTRRHPGRRLVVLGAGFALVLGLLCLPSGRVEERLHSLADPLATDSGQVRLTSWRDSLALWQDYPWLGVGAEGFRAVFSAYRSDTLRKTFYNAENEYVQLLTDHGLVGVVLALASLGALALAWWRGRGRWEQGPGTAWGLLGGLTVGLVHAGVDFALRIPLYALLLALLAGLLLPPGQARDDEEDQGDDRLWADAEARGPAWPAPLLGITALGVVAVLAVTLARPLYRLDTNMGISGAAPPTLCQALVWAPTQCQIWHNLGRQAFGQESPAARRFGEWCLTEGVRYNANDYRVWQDLATMRTALGDDAGALRAVQEVLRLRPVYLPRYGTPTE
jgi:O-antigen ligase